MRKLVLSLMLVGLTAIAATGGIAGHPNGPGFSGPPVHGVKSMELRKKELQELHGGIWF